MQEICRSAAEAAGGGEETDKFTTWLRTNKIHVYQQALEDEGYDDLESFSMIPENDIEALCETLKMKPGHRRKMPALVNRAKEDFKVEIKLKQAQRERKILAIEEEAEDRKEERMRKKNERVKEEEAEGLEQPEKEMGASKVLLPDGKRYAYFASHKKQHTRFGGSSADLARASKDFILLKYDLEGYFDADNLRRISKAKISEGIVLSCSVLLFLNDETLTSEWCLHEVKEARRYGIPIICVVDVDYQPVKEVIDHHMACGFYWLFDDQVISYSTQSRDHTYELIVEAIKTGIHHCETHDTFTARYEQEPADENKQSQDVHDIHMDDRRRAGADTEAGFDSRDYASVFRQRVLQEHKTTKAAFDRFKETDEMLSRKAFKALVGSLSMPMSDQERKQLRKKISPLKAISFKEFSAFFTSHPATLEKPSGSDSRLTELPSEVPNLPASFIPREHAQQNLTLALLNSAGKRSTALTAPKSRISSQGMGGVGKTMLTAAVVRSEVIRAAFQVICWLSLSQHPELIHLQKRLYQQLSDNNDMPKKNSESIESQLTELKRAARGLRALVVLDDIWNSEHERAFSCIDPGTASKLLCTTRIKGIMPKGTEVTLELLGLQESVELIVAVAELHDNSAPPVLLEIAALCGRLPLCLNIVGNLIRTFGGGWEEEIPSILKKDMKSLTTGKSDSSQPLNLQQRVIQSGLDSLEGEDAADIVLLFKGMAVFAEDQIVPVVILSVLWVSINPKEHKPLSAMKVRQWVSQLLSRSILLGSSTDGVSMHDIVRDFTLASSTSADLQTRQRLFAEALIDAVGNDSGGYATTSVQNFIQKSLAFHVRSSVIVPLRDDPSVLAWLMKSDLAVVDQVLAGLECSHVDDLATWLENTQKEYLSAAKLWSILGIQVQTAGAPKANYLRKALAVVQRVELQQRISLEFEVRYKVGCFEVYLEISLRAVLKLSFLYGTEKDKDENLDWILGLRKSTVKQLNKLSQTYVLWMSGSSLAGITNSKYCFNITMDQLMRGVALGAEAFWGRWHATDKAGGFGRWYSLSMCFCWPSCWTIAYLLTEETNDMCAHFFGKDASLLVAWHDSYSLDYHKAAVARTSEGFHDLCVSFLVFERFGAVHYFARFVGDWEQAHQNAKQVGVCDTLSFIMGWPRLPPAVLSRAMSLWGVSWKTAGAALEKLRSLKMGWSRQKGDTIVNFAHSEMMLLNVQLLMLARFPERVPEAAAAEFLPGPACIHFTDRITEVGSFGEGPLALAAAAAEHTAMRELSEQYSRAALTTHRNFIRQQHAHSKLSTILVLEGEAEST